MTPPTGPAATHFPAMTQQRANAVALAAACAWGFSGVPHKTIIDHLDGFTATGLTCLLGALLVLPFARAESAGLPPRPKEFMGLTLKVSIFFALGVTFQQLGYAETSATNAGFLVNTVAVITPILAWFLFRERLTAGVWLASLITMIGIVLLTESSLTSLSPGAVLCLTSAVFYSFWTLFVGQHVMLVRRPLELTFLQLLFAGLVALTAGILIYGFPAAGAVSAALPEIIIISVFARAAAYALNAIAQQHISAACAAIIVSAEAVFGAFFAMLLLGESLTLSRAWGATLIILGVIAASNGAAMAKGFAQLARPKTKLKARPTRRKMVLQRCAQAEHDATHPDRAAGIVPGRERIHGR